MPLSLRVPQQDEKLDSSLEVRPVYLEEWIEGLPYANPLQVIRILFDRVRALNRAPLRPTTRFEVLEVFLPTLAYLKDVQVRAADAASAANFERNRTSTDGARQLATQLAYGYKLVLAQSADQSGLFGGKRLHRQAAQRSMQLLAQVVVHAYHEYLPSISHVWTELGHIYQYARDEHLERAEGKGFARDDVFSDSVEAAYKRVTLLALADPFRLSGGAVWRLHEHLGGPSSGINLVPVAEAPSKEARHGWALLDSELDVPPVRFGAHTLPEHGAAWIFDPRPAATELRELVTRLVDDERGYVARAANTIAERQERRGERIPSDGMVEISNGLIAVHHFLSAGVAPAEEPKEDGIEVHEDGDIDIGLPEESEAVLTLTPSYAAERWDIINRGSGGLSLSRPEQVRTALLVGDVVALRHDHESPWLVGIVRWLSIATPSDYRIGVETLGDRGRAIHLSEDSSGTERLDTLPKALLTAGRTGPGSMSILAPRGTYREGGVIFAIVAGQRLPLRLRQTRMLELIGTIEMFACEAV